MNVPTLSTFLSPILTVVFVLEKLATYITPEFEPNCHLQPLEQYLLFIFGHLLKLFFGSLDLVLGPSCIYFGGICVENEITKF